MTRDKQRTVYDSVSIILKCAHPTESAHKDNKRIYRKN